ncbi:hypothetical protein GIB67_026424 [Kingdonia uniflora]|uniref:Fructose-1-6-bisphosphatase class 1 C-terminal domain-containing protein n=1 Tax=Kingdonia uniflora TaxID=39325 RepID=A0A7J7P662_9MAGN|nr:hypothetical protein GIB67_026424 [Kingdonia uniflora]
MIGRYQVTVAMGIYGPRTTYVIALKGMLGTHELLLLDKGKWQHVKDTAEINEGKMFSPGNLRATFDNPNYQKLIDYYIKEKYTLRYTGGMVPDVNQIIVKENVVFMNAISPSAKVKLRLLFKVAPLGLLVENAGGYSSDGYKSVLDKVITALDERTQVSYGSKNEIIRLEETMYGMSRLKAALELRKAKWHGSVGGLVGAPIENLWTIVFQSSRLPEWMPMVENYTNLAGEEGFPGYVRLVSGFVFPQDDGDGSWIKKRLIFMDPSLFSYAYEMVLSNVGLDASVNSLKLSDLWG